MNSDKCRFISGSKFERLWTNDKIWETRTARLLGIIIDTEIKFDEHLRNLYLKANKKVSLLTRIRKCVGFNKIRILFKVFFES